jgi:hypothetical protein
LRAFDVFPAGVSDILARALPALLILAGLSLLLPGRIPLGNLVALILTVALVGGVTMVAYSSRETQQREDQQLPIEQAIDSSVTLLAVNVSTLDADVEIFRSENAEKIIAGEFVGSTESHISITYNEQGDGSAEFTLNEEKSADFPLLEAVGRGRLRLEIPADVGVALAFAGENGNVTLNMSDLSLERLNIELDSGNAVVTLPEYQPLSPNAAERPGQLIVNNGTITLFVPATVSATLELNRGGNNIRPEFDPSYILIDDGADGTLEKREVGEDEIQLFYEITAPRGLITLQSVE